MVTGSAEGDRARRSGWSGGRPEGLPLTPAGVSGAERAALKVLQLGALAVVVVASTRKAYELDRFFVPKELVLHVTALLTVVLLLGSFRRVPFTRIDLLLVGFLLLSAASGLGAEHRALAVRATAVSASGVAVFWAARGLREAGLGRPLLATLAGAVVLGCVTSLLQTYGVRTDLFSLNRAPGGTLGNRNFVAHLAAFGLPLLLFSSLRAWRAAGYLIWTGGIVLVSGSLVLTRSRAGWLAAAAVLVVVGAAMLLSPPLRRDGRTWRRLTGILALGAAGVAGSLLLPNTLRWRSDNPYLESVRAVANYQEGSGRGRLVQYRQSLRMALDRPLLGVGPGNWPRVYPDYAARGDPSLSRRNPGTTANPWPSSDWIAFLAERGIPATLLLVLAFLGLAADGLRRIIRARDAEEGLAAGAFLATVLATAIAGLFDAVLLLALPALIAWSALGALRTPETRPAEGTRSRAWLPALVLVGLAAAVGAFRSAARLLEIGF